MLYNKHILLGITGSIAAYKALELIRLLRNEGAIVEPCVTQAALQFVTLPSVHTLSASSHTPGEIIAHIESAYKADIAVIAPATANCLAKMAHGLADEPLLQTLLSFDGPVVVAPAMESNMWHHPATQHNVDLLKARGVHIIEPQSGALASGRTGIGRLADLPSIIDIVRGILAKQDYKDKNVLVTAGPTIEDIDPVRFLSNRSSGRMGVELAQAFAMRGANVTLVHGPLSIPVPTHSRIRSISIRSAEQMYDKVITAAPQMDIAVLCAAVADYKPRIIASQKHKKSHGPLVIDLEPTPDILRYVGQLEKKPFLVGFAAETENIFDNAMIKCREKRCDLVCANDVSGDDLGFESNNNAITIVGPNGIIKELETASKSRLAHQVLDVIVAANSA